MLTKDVSPDILNLLKFEDVFKVITADVFWTPSLNLKAWVIGGFWFTKLLLAPAPLDIEVGNINKNEVVFLVPVTTFIEFIWQFPELGAVIVTPPSENELAENAGM